MNKSTRPHQRFAVTPDGAGVVSHAGVSMIREVAALTGLSAGITKTLSNGYTRTPIHPPGRVFTDLATAIADGADAITGVESLTDRKDLHGPVASMATTWRVLDRIDDQARSGIRDARAKARARAWSAGARPHIREGLCMDFDASIVISHSDGKEKAAPTFKHTFGYHPLLCFLDRPDIAGGEALAGLLRAGNAGSNTATDHVTVLDQALQSLPEHVRPRPGDPQSPRLLARSDTAGATHVFASACTKRGVEYSFRFPVDFRIQSFVDLIPDHMWEPALDTDEGLRDGAWVTEVTSLVNLETWPRGSRLILRKERPHPGAQLTFASADGMRITAFLTNTGPGVVPGQAAGLERRHRQHARVEDRIRQAKACGMRNFPCRGFAENQAWLEAVLTAQDLIAWTKLLAFASETALAKCEVQAFRYRVLHVAARITRSGRRTRLAIDRTWKWAVQIAAGFHRIRAAFA